MRALFNDSYGIFMRIIAFGFWLLLLLLLLLLVFVIFLSIIVLFLAVFLAVHDVAVALETRAGRVGEAI